MNIKKLAEERNIDAHKLSRDLDISYTYADLLLKSKRQPSVKVMKKAREVYNVPLGGIGVS
jgi:transcriptional regulator with XRE-family HTH domain|tara:strand:- start:200 stop:382 length:183 start_codon:yes stop_codon:yes gene_type:complete